MAKERDTSARPLTMADLTMRDFMATAVAAALAYRFAGDNEESAERNCRRAYMWADKLMKVRGELIEQAQPHKESVPQPVTGPDAAAIVAGATAVA